MEREKGRRLLDARLFEAVEFNDLEAVKNLLKKGANPNARDAYGGTPLHNAAFKSNLKMLKELIKKGGIPNAENDLGQTPLNCAIGEEVKRFLKSKQKRGS